MKSKTGTTYRTITWGTKGQRAGTRILEKKGYTQLGSARSYAQKTSRKPGVEWVEIKIGDELAATYKRGELVADEDLSLLAQPSSPPDAAKSQKKTTVKAVRSSAVARAALPDPDGCDRYQLMVEGVHTGQLARMQHYAKFGIDTKTAATIRDMVRATTPSKKTPARAAAAAKTRPSKKTRVQAMKKSNRTRLKIDDDGQLTPVVVVPEMTMARRDELEQRVITETNNVLTAVAGDLAAAQQATIIEAALRALTRERNHALAQAQAACREVESTCRQMGIELES